MQVHQYNRGNEAVAEVVRITVSDTNITLSGERVATAKEFFVEPRLRLARHIPVLVTRS